jgi:RimJ/RimL family protein N-acetyltransferase
MNIKNNRINLRAIEETDLEQMQVWANDPDIQYYLGGWHFPINKNDQLKWFNNLSCHSNNQRFIIEDENTMSIGMANLVNINFKDGNAEHGLLIDKKYQGKGYAIDVVNAIMKYSFCELRLNRLDTTIIENNIKSLNLFSKLGWTKEGEIRNWYFRNGKYINKYILGILQNEYFKKCDYENK